MALALSELVLSTYARGLRALSHILAVAERHARASGLPDPETAYADARLIDDMRPLAFQVQNATRTVRATLERLGGAGSGAAEWDNSERTLAELRARVESALALVEAADREAIDARAAEEVELPLGTVKVIRLSAKESALNHGIPNFFFHLQTAYAILRSKGVPLGKLDYIGSFLGEKQ